MSHRKTIPATITRPHGRSFQLRPYRLPDGLGVVWEEAGGGTVSEALILENNKVFWYR
tara:strand:- start:68 stop:241 length:174 start_codon:yes stop_codon:yes gene_type:complete